MVHWSNDVFNSILLFNQVSDLDISWNLYIRKVSAFPDNSVFLLKGVENNFADWYVVELEHYWCR